MRALLAAIFLDDTGGLDVQQLFFFGAVGLIATGAGAIYPPAAYLAPGVILLWTYLPTRPPFVARLPTKPAMRPPT